MSLPLNSKFSSIRTTSNCSKLPEKKQRQTAMLRTQRCPELNDVANQPGESGRTEVAQSAIGRASVPAMIDGVDQETGCVQRSRKAVVAFTMLRESVGDLHHASRCAGNVGPRVGDDLRAVSSGEKGGGRGAHCAILTRWAGGFYRSAMWAIQALRPCCLNDWLPRCDCAA